MELVPIFRGESNIACKRQLARARSDAQTISEIMFADNLILDTLPIKQHCHGPLYPGCNCRIAENGCIDPSECNKSHHLFAIPRLNRWCDMTTSRLRGCGALLFWSGWARPAVMKLIGRHPTVELVAWMIKNCSPNTLHVKYRFVHRLRFDTELNCRVIDLSSSFHEGMKGNELLRMLDPSLRFGQHSLKQAETVSNN